MISKGNHVEFARFVLLDVTGRSKNMTSTFDSLTEQDIEKIGTHKKRKGLQRLQSSCLMITWKRKNWVNLGYFYTLRNKLSVSLTVVIIFFRSMYNKIVIRWMVFGISRIIKDSVRVISLNLYPASTGFSLAWLLAFMAQSIPSTLPPPGICHLVGPWPRNTGSMLLSTELWNHWAMKPLMLEAGQLSWSTIYLSFILTVTV